MYKSRFFQFILRVIDWMNERRQEVYFILLTIIVLGAVGFGLYMFIYYSNNPMFKYPLTIPEHFARPIFIGMLSTVLILIFGIFFVHLITMVPFRRIKFFKMEMEFDADTIKEKHVANQFLYTSTMLHNHTENVRYLLDNNLFELKQVLQFLTDSYKNHALKYYNDLELSIDILDSAELVGREEKKLFKYINNKLVNKSNTIYTNRLLGGENLLVGSVSVLDTEKVAIVIRRGYVNPFDIYDQETFESIFGYATILFDTIIMIQLLKENNVLDASNESKSEG